jgi:hypothetical protein
VEEIIVLALLCTFSGKPCLKIFPVLILLNLDLLRLMS